jgi:hypothetical protein
MVGRHYIITVLFSTMPGIRFLSPEKVVCQKLLSLPDRTNHTRLMTVLFENALPDCYKLTALSFPSEYRDVLHKNILKFLSQPLSC